MLTLEDWIVGSTRDARPVEVVLLSSIVSGLFNQGRNLTRITCDTRGLEDSEGSRPPARSLTKLDHLTSITDSEKTRECYAQTDRSRSTQQKRIVSSLSSRTLDETVTRGRTELFFHLLISLSVLPDSKSDQFQTCRTNLCRRE